MTGMRIPKNLCPLVVPEACIPINSRGPPRDQEVYPNNPRGSFKDLFPNKPWDVAPSNPALVTGKRIPKIRRVPHTGWEQRDGGIGGCGGAPGCSRLGREMGTGIL